MSLAIWSLAEKMFHCTFWSLAATFFIISILANGDPFPLNIYLILTSFFVLLNHNLYYEE